MNLLLFLFFFWIHSSVVRHEVILSSDTEDHDEDDDTETIDTNPDPDVVCLDEHIFCVGECLHCNSTTIADVIPYTLEGGYSIYLVGSTRESTEHHEELNIVDDLDEHYMNYIQAFPGHTIIWTDESFHQLLTVSGSWWSIDSGLGTLVLENLDRSVMNDFISVTNVEGFTLGPVLMNLNHDSVSMENFVKIEVNDHEHQEIVIDRVKFSYFEDSHVEHAISIISTDEHQTATPLHHEQISIKNCFFTSISSESSLRVEGSLKNIYIEGNYFTHTRKELTPSTFIEFDSGLAPEIVIQNNIFEVGSEIEVELENNNVDITYRNSSKPSNVTFMNNLFIHPNTEVVGLEVTYDDTEPFVEFLTVRVHSNIISHPFNHCEVLFKTSHTDGIIGSYGSNYRSWPCPSWIEGGPTDPLLELTTGELNMEFNGTNIFYEHDEKPYPYYNNMDDTLLIGSTNYNPGHDYFFREKSHDSPTAGPFEKLCSFFCGYSSTWTASRGLCEPGGHWEDGHWDDFYCSCVNGYSGSECTCLPHIQNYSESTGTCYCLNDDLSHFIITHDGCICEEGYSGTNCDDPICYGIAGSDHESCGGEEQGHCLHPDECHCLDDYIGDECDRVWGVSQKVGLGFVCFFIFLSMLICLCVVCVDSTLHVIVRKVEGRPIVNYKSFISKVRDKLKEGKKEKEKKKKKKGKCCFCFGGKEEEEEEVVGEGGQGDGQDDDDDDVGGKMEYVDDPESSNDSEEEPGSSDSEKEPEPSDSDTEGEGEVNDDDDDDEEAGKKVVEEEEEEKLMESGETKGMEVQSVGTIINLGDGDDDDDKDAEGDTASSSDGDINVDEILASSSDGDINVDEILGGEEKNVK